MPEYDCLKCKMWKACPGKEWYDYGEIRWCPHQVIWILQNAGELEAGIYPEQFKGQSRQLRAEAYFIKAKLIIGEVKYRLNLTDNQGELLVTQVEDGRTLNSLSDGAYAILIYVKGWRRKSMDFNALQRQKKYRKMITKS